jgi:formylglycine-generating enzyme
VRGGWPLLLALTGCQLFSSGKKKPNDRAPASVCPAPEDPALLGIAPELRNELVEAAKRGVVVFRYTAEGCTAHLSIARGCKFGGEYEYAAKGDRRSAVIKDEAALFAELPLRADSVVRALHQYGALRVDEEVVGRLEAPESRARDRSSLAGDCGQATHIAVAIDLGGASVVAGSLPTVSSDRNWFLKPTQSKTNPAALQYLGRVGVCLKAHGKAKRTPGCDHPLRVQLRAIGERTVPKDEEVEPPPPPPPEDPPPPEPSEMIAIPAGEFRMGNARSKNGDGPQHVVQLGAFEIDKREVTVAEYASCVAAGACMPPATGRFCNTGEAGREKHPINCVTWKQAAQYCVFVKKRLPTEAEWERAARGTDARRFAWGDAWPPPKGSGNFADHAMREGEPEWRAIDGYDDGHVHTAPATGDFAGNVQEWVADWYGPYGAKKASDPKGPAGGKARVVRGGSFGHATPEALEVTHRAFYLEDYESAHIGFRCAR